MLTIPMDRFDGNTTRTMVYIQGTLDPSLSHLGWVPGHPVPVGKVRGFSEGAEGERSAAKDRSTTGARTPEGRGRRSIPELS